MVLGLKASGSGASTEAFAAGIEATGLVACRRRTARRCSVSFLNSIYYATVDHLLTQTLDVKYHSNIMAAADDLAISAANAAYTKGGYILIVEGAIPTGAHGKYCQLWPGLRRFRASSSSPPRRRTSSPSARARPSAA